MTHSIALYLGCAVPLEIAALESAGGPDADDYAAAQAFGAELAARGDVMLYGGKPGEAGALASQCARSIAVLSFSPGGVTVFGEHWEARAWPVGAYYTPRALLEVIEPSMGSGAFLAGLAQNPPWGQP